MEIISKNPADCVVTALSAHTGVSYDTMLKYLETNKFYVKGEGTKIVPLMKTLQYRKVKTPRRGQDDIFSAIACFGSINKRCKHAVIIREGKVYDAFYPDGIKVSEYRRVTGYHLQLMYVREF